MAAPTNTRFAVAVHALTYLAGLGAQRAISSDEIAGSANVNPVHIRTVMGPLREAGIVVSRAGARGGWQLTRDPASISLAEVWDVLQGDDPVLGLHGPSPECPVGVGVQAALVDLDREVAEAVRARLRTSSVAGMLGDLELDPATWTSQLAAR
ncbi:Rrf2 family transcriptional regulator [Nocardioides mangrovicus]|uniref:Rrf2 family transcriptional regulator n=1 Tax=Nocardioides mangrovicus TaxID=2478913 RepID=A0A3L8P819_9ACTN|nr:Rrf2 family transcriptional regulator [Nocardioides mangrovicus]RLV50528.1 Rrf2 family transcriptional regulator [Nocardioides mangrovicus]